MQRVRSAREFGKRHRAPRELAPVREVFAVPTNRQAMIDGLRNDLRENLPADQRIVPYSFRAAILAGLIVGFFLAGLDIGKFEDTTAIEPLLDLAGLYDYQAYAAPAMIALSLLSGARAAATALLIAHRGLAAAGQTSPIAYILGGAAINLCCAAGLQILTHSPPRHGWAAEIAAGAAAGLFYRMFAGAKSGGA